MTETIQANGQIIAIIIYSGFRKQGIEFFTSDDSSFQLGYMNRKAGFKVEAHSHKETSRHILNCQEVLFIKSGSVKVFFYDNNNEFLNHKILSSGDCILLASGGHGIEMLEDTEMIEVKQGPFKGDGDKTFLKAGAKTGLQS